VRGLLACAVVAVALFAAPGLAAAETICVAQQVSGCDSSSPDIQAALESAHEAPGDDRVVIGAGRFEGPFAYPPGGGGRIEVVGQGPSTVLTAAPPTATGTTILELADPDGSSVSGLTVRIPAGAGSASADSGIRADAVTGVRVSSDANESSAGEVGVLLPRPGGILRSSVIELVGGGGDEVAVEVSGGSTSATTVVSDSRITAPVAVEATAQATAVVRDRILSSRTGVFACNSQVTVEDTLVRVFETGIGLLAEGDEQCGSGQAELTARQVTVVGGGTGAGQTGADASAGVAGQSPRVDVSLSILRDLETVFLAEANASGTTADIRVGASDFEAGRHQEVGAQGTPTFELTEPDIDADPLFTGELLGEFGLRLGSPAIDSAFSPPLAPGESATDLSGSPRLVDGNGDGVAARDMGAFEAPAPPDTVPPDTTILLRRGSRKKPLRAGAHGYVLKVTFASTEPGSTFECRLDTGGFLPCASPYRKRIAAGVHRIEVRAIDPAGNVDPSPARARVRIAAPRRRHRHRHRHRRHAHPRHRAL
jgi:hypothetical protein